MYQQAVRIRGIVEDMLTLSTLESGDRAQERQFIDLSALLGSLREEGEVLSGERRHWIVLDYQPGFSLYANPEEVQSAFSNLVSNAVRYTPDGGEIRMRWWVDSHGAYFSVSDNGIGIEAEHIPRLTERFYRVDKGRSRETGGTGLGLAIVKHVLGRVGGYLEIQSKPGVGSTFTCHFPLRLLVKAAA
jgi:two-component system phosphate regulon sensor histidine kinase PhoR